MSEEITLEYAKFCVEEYLVGKIKPLMLSIDDALMRIRECEERLQLVGIDYSKGMARGSVKDRMGEGIVKLEQLHDELEIRIASAVDDVEHARSLCPINEPQRHALWLHYIQGMPWGKAARAVGFSRSGLLDSAIKDGYRELAIMIPIEFRENLPEAFKI